MLKTGGMSNPNLPPAAPAGAEDGNEGDDGDYIDKPEQGDAQGPVRKATGGGKGSRPWGRGDGMGSKEWTRQRKDNNKEVERRRSGSINEGINDMGRIVPSGSGEKGAILSCAVQCIHHLKENESGTSRSGHSRVEKLLMDQAMGDLQI
ncbi:hypothetical protein B0H14DRAFT_3447103 [Mycena olivaceomarginata]|nr:hypothetical protein B0H14DRAFT_3447103 [Mycena olivaceomarginata]